MKSVSTGEVRPLLKNGKEVKFHQRTRRRKSFTASVCAIVGASMLLVLIFILYTVISKGSQKLHQERKRAHQHDIKTNEIYSKNADDNLQALLNTQPPTNTAVGCQGTVIIMPHCESYFKKEKGPGVDRDHCNYLGLQRSFYLITQFGTEKRWPIPRDIFVFGSKFRRKRAMETMLPLQKYYNVQGRSEPSAYSNRALLVKHIASLITNGELCSHIITVTTAFTIDIPNIASDLGCGPINAGAGCPIVYDRNDVDKVWELRFVYDEKGDESLENKIHGVDANSTVNLGADELKWHVYGNVVSERFDPLAFSKLVGEYDPGASIQEYPGVDEYKYI
jgi:hypothetical protein